MIDQDTASYTSIFSIGLSLGLVSLVLFISLVQNNFNLALPAGGMLIIGIGTRIWSRRSLHGLEISIEPDTERLFQGEELRLNVHLENRKLLPIIAGLEMRSRFLLNTEQQNFLSGETRLLSYEKSRRTWTLTAQKRGVSSLGEIRISSGDLLGFHTRKKTLPCSREIIIFPRKGELQPLNIPFQEFFGINASKGPVDDPAWYVGTRDYSGNRPSKNIHWKASARLGKLQEKLYEPTSHCKVLLVLDLSGFDLLDDPGDFEHLITCAGTLATVLMEAGASFGLVTNAALSGESKGLLPIGRGPEHLGILLEILARIERKETKSILPLLNMQNQGNPGIAYCAARTPDSLAENLFDTFSRRRKILFILSRLPDIPSSHTESASDALDPVFWRDFPAYRAREVVHAE